MSFPDAPIGKEAREQSAALVGQHAALDLCVMIQALDGEQVDDAAMHARLWIARAVDDAGDPRMQDRA